ncbi:hypothetical protein M2333_001610 [Sphingobium sp. B11D3B]|uniref:hypothetical protein n=1 Tax=Sphingobium sp. B11D3B TaxID=2940575 RepID=UPI0022263662|nr:hypothetical protein [Sphingobium sp. B11D3B]MCW2388564.1 hypothetical protein [Sphingobium sp. B11D3B]
MEPTIFDKNMMWQDHLPTGWSGLYQQFIERLTAIDPTLRVTGAKRKFGELCIRFDRYNREADALARVAEQSSRTLCQMCSAPGELRADMNSVYATLCDLHAGATRPSDRPAIYSIIVHPSDD